MDFVAGVSGNFIPAVDPVGGTKDATRKYALPSGTSNAGTNPDTVGPHPLPNALVLARCVRAILLSLVSERKRNRIKPVDWCCSY